MKKYSRHVCSAVVAALGALSMAVASAGPIPNAKHAQPRHGWPSTGLVRTVQNSTWQFQRLSKAEAAGYGLASGCVSSDAQGAMGVHYARPELIGDGTLDASQPELLVYEPMPNGRMQFVAVEYLVLAEGWDAAHPGAPPILEGQHFHYLGSPNRYGLPAAYILHVWAWKHNPNGMFTHWNSRVSCEYYAP